MYPPAHPTVETGFQQLVAATSRMVEAASPARLIIGDTDIRLFDEAVYTGDPGTDNLAFILFRDGIRELLLYEGVERDELAQLVDALANVDAIERWDHDLVTVLWETDLPHIDYVVADPMVGGAQISADLIDSLRDGVLRRLTEAEQASEPPVPGAGAVDAYGIDDATAPLPNEMQSLLALIEQPLPDLSTLRELDEDPCPLEELHVFLLPLLPQSRSTESAGLLVRSLTAVIGARIQSNDLVTARYLIAQLHRSAQGNAFVGNATQALDLTAPEYRHGIRELLTKGGAHGSTDPEAHAILNDSVLRPVLLPTLIELLAHEADRNVRRSIISLLTAAHDIPVALLVPYLGDSHWYVVRNAIQLLAFSPDARPLVHLRQTAHYPDKRVRKEAVRTLGRMGAAGQEASILLRQFLRDSDAGVRTLAARMIGPEAGEAGVAELLLQLEHPDFPTRSVDEVEAVCDALARVANGKQVDTQVVSALHNLWRPRFWKKNPAAVRIAALKALAAMKDQKAASSLRAAAASKDGTIRPVARSLLAKKQAERGEI